MPNYYLKITARRLLRQKTLSLINIFGLSMGLAAWTGWTTLLIPVLLFPLTVLLAGGYPALVLSRFRPISAFQDKPTGPAKGAHLRKVLTVAQFVIALAMLARVVVFFGRMQFMQHRDLGLEQRQVLRLSVPQDSVSAEIAPAFYQALRQESGIHGVTVGTGLPTDGAIIQGIEVNSKGRKDSCCVMASLSTRNSCP